MKRDDLENKIRASFDAEVPDLLGKIEESCKAEKQETAHSSQMDTGRLVLFTPMQRRVIAAVLCLVIFVGGIFVGRIDISDTGAVIPSADTFVYLDVNPSVEISVDGDGAVVACLAANGDAEGILSGLSLEGVELNTAVSAIVGSMYVNGYLSDTKNSILVSVAAPSEEKTSHLISELTEKINSFFEGSALDCSIIAQAVEVTGELKERAKENGVSVGKMHLVDKMLDGIEDLAGSNAQELAGMSIQDLSFIYSTHKGKGESNKFDKDTVSGSANGYLDESAIDEIIAEALGIDVSSIDGISVRLSLENEGGRRRLVYHASVRIIGNLSYVIRIDCESGEVIDSRLDTGLPDHTEGGNSSHGLSGGDRDDGHVH